MCMHSLILAHQNGWFQFHHLQQRVEREKGQLYAVSVQARSQGGVRGGSDEPPFFVIREMRAYVSCYATLSCIDLYMTVDMRVDVDLAITIDRIAPA